MINNLMYIELIDIEYRFPIERVKVLLNEKE